MSRVPSIRSTSSKRRELYLPLLEGGRNELGEVKKRNQETKLFLRVGDEVGIWGQREGPVPVGLLRRGARLRAGTGYSKKREPLKSPVAPDTRPGVTNRPARSGGSTVGR